MIFFIQSNVIHKEKQRCDANLFVFTFKTTFLRAEQNIGYIAVQVHVFTLR